MEEGLPLLWQAAAAGGLVSLALATLVSEDLACITAGILVSQGRLGFGEAALACFVGILAGDLLLVMLGRTLGRRSLEVVPLRWWVSPGAVRRAEAWFSRRGPGLILASRFTPGTRLPTFVAAGVLRAPLGRFLLWFVLACALWTPLLVGAGVLFGEGAEEVFNSWIHHWPVLVAAGLAALGLTRLATTAATWRGRQRIVGRWRRLVGWEFWPLWAVYPPVVLYIFWLGVRHRCPTLFTVANPGIGAGGGLVGESKSEILKGLAGAGDAIATWCRLAPGAADERLHELQQFMAEKTLTYPIVLKPDVGERGSGVVIARDEAQARQALVEAPEALIAQAYVPGVEYGVFYYRLPSAEHGHLLAITDKRMVEVRGDGTSTLEELILRDDRAVCSAALFLRRFESRLDEVPKRGEMVALSELGTHCRGALFLDGGHLAGPTLLSAVERISRTFKGFYFGRYDIRAASVEAFQEGNFKVIELNGLSSEATSIYDPRHRVWFGWRMLMKQWAIAFAIAAENRARGFRPLTLKELYRVIWPATTKGRAVPHSNVVDGNESNG